MLFISAEIMYLVNVDENVNNLGSDAKQTGKENFCFCFSALF